MTCQGVSITPLTPGEIQALHAGGMAWCTFGEDEEALCLAPPRFRIAAVTPEEAVVQVVAHRCQAHLAARVRRRHRHKETNR